MMRPLWNRNDTHQSAGRALKFAALTVAIGLVIGCGGGGSSNGAGGRGGGPVGAGTGGGTPGGGLDAGTASTGGVGGPVGAGDLGKACASAADCGGGLTCLLPTDKAIFGQGGPANGYCTFACAALTDEGRCQTAGGNCLDFAISATAPSQAYCMQNCVFGSPGSAVKCRGRGDVACTELESADADGGVAPSVCIPTCSQDKDCPAGRQCDDAFSVCVDVKTAGDPMGAHCAFDPTGMTPDTCAGTCLPLGNGTTVVASFCSRRCVFGQLNACNLVGMTMSLATGGPHGVCLLSNGEAGDLGFCSQQCDTANDCSNKTDPGLTCDTSIPVTGHGFCSWGPPAAPPDAGTQG